MRLAALTAGLALAGAATAATAADAPVRVDLVVEGQVAEIEYAGRQDWPRDIDPQLWISHRHVYVLNVAIRQPLGGTVSGTGIRVYTDYQNWFPTPGRPAVFWLRRDPEGRWRLICAQDPLNPTLAGAAQGLEPDWRTRPNCSPPADVTYEPGG